MILVGLTGGIGSGKSSVSHRLSGRGAVIVDADAIVKDLQGPGTSLLAALADRFGARIITESGALDRAALAGLVFSDTQALADLNALVHPAVAQEMNRRIDAEFNSDRMVVLDIPLLAENPRKGLAAVIVVDCPIEVAVHRLTTQRGFTEDDARSRVSRQATREQRRALATHIIDNAGSLIDLDRQIDTLWDELGQLPATTIEDLARYRATTSKRRADPGPP